jgi:hypothetical protein
VILSPFLLFLSPLWWQEPELTELEAAQRKVSELEAEQGADHPGLGLALNELATILQNQGSYTESRPLYERALSLQEGYLGPEHLDVATTLHNLVAMQGNGPKKTD